MVTLAEDAAMKRDSKELYHIVKDLTSSGPKKGMPIKDDFGKTLSTHEEQAKQWKHHFETVLNCPEPVICNDFNLDVPAPFDIGPEEISISEVQHAIKKLKNNKAAGIDEIPAEYLKGGGDTMAQTLTHICNLVWSGEKVPDDWKKGIILPLPKKGDLANCSNWRGILLLSIPGKVMATVLMNRIKTAIDQQLRPQQTGFRPHRSCCQQIFTLRQIIDKCLAWRKPVLVNYIDFKKAFDCIHRDSLVYSSTLRFASESYQHHQKFLPKQPVRSES